MGLFKEIGIFFNKETDGLLLKAVAQTSGAEFQVSAGRNSQAAEESLRVTAPAGEGQADSALR